MKTREMIFLHSATTKSENARRTIPNQLQHLRNVRAVTLLLKVTPSRWSRQPKMTSPQNIPEHQFFRRKRDWGNKKIVFHKIKPSLDWLPQTYLELPHTPSSHVEAIYIFQGRMMKTDPRSCQRRRRSPWRRRKICLKKRQSHPK